MKKTILSALLLACSLFQVVLAEWVYIGEYGVDGPISTSFELRELPLVGETIRAEEGVNLRDDRPRIKNFSWTLGEVVGVIYPGEWFVIDEISTSRGGRVPGDVWAKGSVKP
ncbi:MAG: hypothetical protein HN344_09365 [Gammaproteobacteria bacterium]|jgi:hypothetical protein|nr:hypothetical protein [Gammaproteobacteria bacterium]